MQRAFVLALLVASVLFAGNMQAQRGGGGARGGATRAGVGVGGHPGSRNGFPANSRRHNNRNDALLYPYWDDGYGWYDDDYGGPIEEQQPPPVMMVPPGRSMAREVPAPNPKVIELPSTAGSAASKPLPPAIFILTNGERLEAQNYLLTHDKLNVTVDRQQRTIPVSMLNINATIAANRERGINLRIPADRNEISLSF